MNSDPQSDVMIIKASKYAVLLLVKKLNPRRYHLFTINTLNGSFSYDGIEGKSTFSKKNEAFQYIKKHYDFTTENVFLEKALIGAARFGKYLYILTVQKFMEVARIQNKHSIYLIKKVSYFTIELPFYPPLTAKEQRRIERIKQFPIKNYHLWCPTADLTTPVFSNSHDESFVWNKYWQEPFASFGLSDLCIDMLQGTAVSKILQFNETNDASDLDYYRFTLITLRESSNGGLRYYSRGLDEESHPGNEVQSELIVETNSGKFWSHVWRRGSIPIEWKTVMAKNFPSVSVSISPQPGRNTPAYFERLHETFPGSILCMNLLHNQESNSEYPLCNAYKESVKNLPRVQYIEFDWHSEVKSRGLSDAVKSFYDSLPSLPNSEENDDVFNIELTYTKTDEDQYVPPQEATPDLFDNGQDPAINNKVNIHFKNEADLPLLGGYQDGYITQQKKLIRFNCMDSLDRTNVGCFFYAAKVISKIMIDAGVVLRSSKQRSDEIEDYSDLMNGIPLSIRRFLCEAFIKIGDVIAFLYTNTPACMTDTFFEVAEVDPKRKEMRENVAASKPQNDSSIAVKRRYHNFLTDKNRQKTFNMFRGKLFDELIPNVNCGHVPSSLSSPPNAQFMPPFGTIVDKSAISDQRSSQSSSSSTPTSSKSAQKGKNKAGSKNKVKIKNLDLNNLPKRGEFDLTALLQSAPFSVTAFNANTVLIILSRYSYVRDICLVLVPSEFAPTSVRISFSLTFGPKLPLVPRTALPRVDKPTPVMIKVPPDFANHTGNLPQRFLWFEFVAPTKVSLSNIFIFGEPYRKEGDNFYKFTYQDIIPDVELPPSLSSSNDDLEDFKKMTPEDFLKSLPDKSIDFDNFIKFEIIRISNKIGRLESIAIAAINGFNPLDFSIDVLKKRISNTASNVNGSESSEGDSQTQPNSNPQAMFAVEWDDVCCVCERKASWKCFECGKAFCDGSESKCSDVHYVGRSNFYASPTLLCDGCFTKYQEHERLLKALIVEYKNFYSYLSQEEFNTSNYVENWLSTFSPSHQSEVSFNLDPTYFPSAFFQNPTEPQFNLVLTETGKVTINSMKKKKQCPLSKGNSILVKDEREKVSSVYNLDSVNDAYLMYQAQDLFLFLGKPLKIDLIEARGSDNLNLEICSHNGSKKIFLNRIASIPKDKLPNRKERKVTKDDDDDDDAIEQITSSDIRRFDESTNSDEYDDDADEEENDEKETIRSDEICPGLLIASESEWMSSDSESSLLGSEFSDDSSDEFVPNENDDQSYNDSFRQSLINSSLIADSVMAISPIVEKEERSYFLPVDLEDRFINLRIKDGSLNYFHVKGQDPPDFAFERDNMKDDSQLKDYELFPNKPIKFIKHAKSVPVSQIAFKKSTSQQQQQAQQAFYTSNPFFDPANNSPSASLLRKLTLVADCGKETKIRGILLQNCQGAHSVILYLCFSQSQVKVISYYLPVFEGSEFAIKFSNVQKVVKVCVQFIDVAPFFKDPKFSLYI